MSYNISDEDKALFHHSQRQTRRLKPSGKVILPRIRTTAKSVAKVAQVEPDSLDLPVDVAKVDGATALSFHRSGVQPRTLQQLRQGKLPSEKTLDLHGLTVIEAQQQLMNFLNHCNRQHLRIVSVIHGKGYNSKQSFPSLKNLVNQLLRGHPGVLAFNSLILNTGAVYVLLKRNCPVNQ